MLKGEDGQRWRMRKTNIIMTSWSLCQAWGSSKKRLRLNLDESGPEKDEIRPKINSTCKMKVSTCMKNTKFWPFHPCAQPGRHQNQLRDRNFTSLKTSKMPRNHSRLTRRGGACLQKTHFDYFVMHPSRRLTHPKHMHEKVTFITFLSMCPSQGGLIFTIRGLLLLQHVKKIAFAKRSVLDQCGKGDEDGQV